MGLRADAAVFFPSVEARIPPATHMARGDRLIQDLAAAMMSSPCRDTPCRVFPSSGIFCPYCIESGACAFHESAAPAKSPWSLPYTLRGAPGLTLPAQPIVSMLGAMDLTANSSADFGSQACPQRIVASSLECIGMEGGSDTMGSEEGSTDVGGSEGCCAASDTSDPCPAHPGDIAAIIGRFPIPHDHQPFFTPKSAQYRAYYRGAKVRAYGARLGAAYHAFAQQAPKHEQKDAR